MTQIRIVVKATPDLPRIREAYGVNVTDEDVVNWLVEDLRVAAHGAGYSPHLKGLRVREEKS